MKFSHFLLAAGLCSFSAASAQTTPASPSQGTRGTGSAAPSSVPSGTSPMPSNPKGNVGSGEVFTTGSPNGSKRTKTSTRKSPMSDGSGKMKSKM